MIEKQVLVSALVFFISSLYTCFDFRSCSDQAITQVITF